jgi:Flp pilus assembly protein TadB
MWDSSLKFDETRETSAFSVFIYVLQSSTIGLVTLDEMKAKQENIVKERERKLAQKQLEKEQEKQRQLEAKEAEKNRQKKQVNCSSFLILLVRCDVALCMILYIYRSCTLISKLGMYTQCNSSGAFAVLLFVNANF